MAPRVEDLFNLLHNENDHFSLFQMYTILQDVQFTEQQRFKQFVSQPILGSDPWLSRLPSVNEAIVVVPTQVNYVGKAETFTKVDTSSMEVPMSYQSTSAIHGYGTVFELAVVHMEGVFSYLSYRDPNLLKTLEVYDETAKFLRELEMDDDALTKAIIGTIGDVDAYQLPDAKGYSSLKDFKEFADAVESIKDNGVVVAVASPDDVEAAKQRKAGVPRSKEVPVRSSAPAFAGLL
ncbi:hypothetical protein HU200_011043 [Digitaria exilis]|uniref:Presequence protease mitochondrial-type C-terminal domain-containing protein n=1 Tax=Digitaria exilis TaxID=1010633 RepID=A0A835KN06_9POAL|nr:hypothetical protein HU200_011043 [Digitaria exilis]